MKSVITLQWLSKSSFQLADTTFEIPQNFEELVNFSPDTKAPAVPLPKTPPQIARYMELLAGNPPHNVLMIGELDRGSLCFVGSLIKEGSLLVLVKTSAERAMLKEAADKIIPSKDISIAVIENLEADSIRKEILEKFGTERALDWVVDSSSEPVTIERENFNAAFPQLRPGASYIFDNFGFTQLLSSKWHQRAVKGNARAGKVLSRHYAKHLADDQKPVHLLMVEMMLASIMAPGVVRRAHLDRFWLRIVRGRDDAENFDLAATANDRFGLLDCELTESHHQYLPQ